MLAIFSDVHANRQALSHVLGSILAMEPGHIICLGDIVGYGAEPVWCVDAVRSSCHTVLCGNHEAALLYGANRFNVPAEQTIDYHRRLLQEAEEGEEEAASERWDFLKGLAHRAEVDGALMVHGSPRNPVQEYLRAEDLGSQAPKLRANFDLVEHVVFIGHTHRPGVITEELRFVPPPGGEEPYRIEPDKKVIINVGSVGQPRDGDSRACFVTVEWPEVRFHRLEYDVEGAARMIEQSGVIDSVLAERLRLGA